MPHPSLKGCPHITDSQYVDRLKAWTRVSESGCWEWTGFQKPLRGMPNLKVGYGCMSYRGIPWMAHRLSYHLLVGPIPPKMFVMHKCDNPPCCNPDHLELGTAQDNSLDASRKGRSRDMKRTHCVHGHEFNEANTKWVRKNLSAVRTCAMCQRIRQRVEAGWPRDLAESVPPIKATDKGRGKKRYLVETAKV